MTRTTAALLALWLATIAFAGSEVDPDPYFISSVQFGFQTNSNPEAALYRQGNWMPVHVVVKRLRSDSPPATLVVESADADGIPTLFAVAVPQMDVAGEANVIGYTRPGSGSDFAIRIQAGGRDLVEPFRRSAPTLLNQSSFFCLGIGTSLDSSQLSIAGAPAFPTVGQIAQSHQLPDSWLGYDAADVVIINLSHRDLIHDLIGDRKQALIEWVRRGGNLIVTLGQEIENPFGDLLPVAVGTAADQDLPRLAWRDGSASDEPLGKIVVSRITPREDRAASTLVVGPADRVGNSQPLVVRGAYGMGRVTVVAFDLDSRTAIEWKSRPQFWKQLLDRAGPRLPAAHLAASPNMSGRDRHIESENLLASELVQKTEQFAGIPVVPFGWVALGIIAYIAIVGPIDFWFLNSVVKRLELTWISFPIIVLTTTVIAGYFGQRIKGNDWLVNKFDLIDVDVASRTIVGRTWYSVFSPRAERKDVEVVPSLSFVGTSDPIPSVNSWLGIPGRAQFTLLAQPYSYGPSASRLDLVPFQVWSTKGFEASWQSEFTKESPLVESTLRQSPSGEGVIGSVTINLPAPVENAVLVVSRIEPVVIPLGTLVPGTPKSVTAQDPRPFVGWVKNPLPNAHGWLPANVLFHERANPQGRSRNAGLRRIDQSWRIENDRTDQAFLVGTLPRLEGLASSIALDALPSQLKIGNVDITLRQDVCFRAIIPVRPANTPRRKLDDPHE